MRSDFLGLLFNFQPTARSTYLNARTTLSFHYSTNKTPNLSEKIGAVFTKNRKSFKTELENHDFLDFLCDAYTLAASDHVTEWRVFALTPRIA